VSLEIAGLLLAGIAIAFANGANDNFKGVATLFGAGVLRCWPALGLATGATLAGSLVALAGGAALAASFSGKGLVPDAVAADPAFMTAVGMGAAATVLLASWRGLPVSTTHALLGALVGVGLVRAGGAVDVARLGTAFAIPLLASPLFAATLAGAQWPAARRWQRGDAAPAAVCLCVGQPNQVAFGGATTAALVIATPSLVIDHVDQCAARGARPLAQGDPIAAIDGLHLMSAAAVSFARGLNDTPKMAPLLLATGLLTSPSALVAVGLGIAIGGLAGARRVAETMSHRIAALNHAQGLVGNLTTALLVLGASRFGLPVSTTHVACGAVIGIGTASGRVHWGAVRTIALAWVTTLPLAAALGALCAWLL
jgi:PiT family inorganic phosphate transporter